MAARRGAVAPVGVAAPPGMKWCTKCRTFHELTDFYTKVGAADGYMNYCKKWQRRGSASSAARRAARSSSPLRESGELAEVAVVRELMRRGIPAHQHSFDVNWQDVTAWGCVRVEVKSASLIRGTYTFSFHTDQRVNVDPDVIVLVKLDNFEDMAVFPAAHPVFIRRSAKWGAAQVGARKRNVTLTPGGRCYSSAGGEVALTDALWVAARHDWRVVEDARLMHMHRLLREFGGVP